jgi:DNA-binding XRE family transcriptional regulator
MSLAFLPNGVTIPYEHTCTMEELRFNTCGCQAAAIKAYKALHGDAKAPDPQIDYGQWSPVPLEQEQGFFRARMLQYQMMAPCRDRLRVLRTATGWSQGELAGELGISRRSVIRYENNQHKSPWPRLAVLLRLQQLEGIYEQQLLAHFSRGGT